MTIARIQHHPHRGAQPTFGEAFKVWLKIGCLSFGGPAGQIAMMHRILVDEKKWIDEPRFLHALNFCMLLPGPEAQQLATYIGWLLHGVRGGLAAGILFVLPGALVMLGLSLLYALGTRRRAGRRRAVRHQGRGAGDRRRGADPHRQARAEDAAAARHCRRCLRRHLLLRLAVSADRDRRGADRLPGRATVARTCSASRPATAAAAAGRPSAGGRPRSRRVIGLVAGGRRSRWPSSLLGADHVLVTIGTVLLQARGGDASAAPMRCWPTWRRRRSRPMAG